MLLRTLGIIFIILIVISILALSLDLIRVRELFGATVIVFPRWH